MRRRHGKLIVRTVAPTEHPHFKRYGSQSPVPAMSSSVRPCCLISRTTTASTAGANTTRLGLSTARTTATSPAMRYPVAGTHDASAAPP